MEVPPLDLHAAAPLLEVSFQAGDHLAGHHGFERKVRSHQAASEDISVHTWRDADGKLAGYICAAPDEADPKTLLCLEGAGDPTKSLAILADIFQRGAYEKLACFTLPHRHPLLQHLRIGAVIVEDRYFDISGWRVRLVNLQSTLKKLTPLLEARMSQS